METLADLLHKSVGQYREVLGHIRGIAIILEQADPDQTRLCCQRLKAMQDKARQTDMFLARRLEADTLTPAAQSFFRERLDLMRQVAEHNRLLFPRLSGMMSMISAEIGQIRQGAAAMSGYKMRPAPRGNIFNNAC